MTNLYSITQNPHFQRIAAAFGFVLVRREWRKAHANTNILGLEAGLASAVFRDAYKPELVLDRTLALINAIQTPADSLVRFQADDIAWLVQSINSDDGKTVMVMLLAYARASVKWYTPARLALLTGDGESTWRKRAAEDPRLMAQRHGKQWIVPQTGLQLAGYAINSTEPEDENHD